MTSADRSPEMRRGLLVMAYGTPGAADDIEAYYTHIRRGRPPSAEQLDNLRRRYEAIGGISPLRAITEAQTAAITATLEANSPGPWTVAFGAKHADPFIEDGVTALLDAGVERIVGLVLAPHYSAASVGAYHGRAVEAVGDRAEYRPIDRWWDETSWVDFHARGVQAGLDALPADSQVLFTAHSLPERALVDDPYPDELFESAAAIGAAAGLARWGAWGLGWQSAGATPEPWRGPDILEILPDLAATGRCDGVLVCSQGFTADHLEVLYDLDIETRAVADDLGLAFARTPSLNADAAVMAALAARVEEVSA